MARKILVRLVGVIACMAAVVTGLDAEAGWRHRRCCAPSCCYTSCCTPSCGTCYDSCGCTTACAPTCSTWRDSCGYCHTSCGWTVVASAPVIVEGCCASTTPAAAAVQTAATSAPARAPTPALPASTASR